MPSWPTMSVGVAFTPGVFTETVGTPGPPRAFSCSRGRQYELARSEAGTGGTTFENKDGRYSTSNATSPFAGLLKLYREQRVTATWAGIAYPVSRSFIERWPQDYDGGGNFGVTQVTNVDAFALIGGQILRSVADHEVLADSPLWLYKLDEPSDSVSAGDTISPGINPAAVRRDSKYGAGTLTFGAATGMADGATGVAFSATTPGAQNGPVSALVLAYNTQRAPFVPNTGGWTLELWVVAPKVVPLVQSTLLLMSSEQGQSVEVSITGGGNVNYTVGNTGLPISGQSSSGSICDGKLHHIVCTFAANQRTAQMFIDGVSTGTFTPASPLLLDELRYHCIGGRVTSAAVQGYSLNGTLARYAGYPGVLSQARVTQHYLSGLTAFSGEDEGARISRLLNYVAWPAALTDIGTGASTMGPALTAGTAVLEAVQKATDDTLGNLWVSGAGKITFRSRAVRQTALTSTVTFGENAAGGEIPYLNDVRFDYDPTFVFNETSVMREGGAAFTARDLTNSPLPYLKSLGERTIGVAFDAEAADQATWLLAQYLNPKLRVAVLTINPSANPASWPVALGLEINSRVTVKRRALNQPAFSIDCFVEAVAHDVAPGSWVTHFLLSPVDSPRAMLWDTDVWDDPSAVWAF
jgi:hypothetical protein